MSIRLLCALVWLLASCQGENTRPYAPPGGGGGSGEGTEPVDAGAGGPDARAMRSGTLCVLSDLRRPNLCAASDALAGIAIENVSTGDQFEAAADGSFEVKVASGRSILRVAAQSAAYRTSIVPVLLASSSTTLRLPILPQATWDSIVALASASETPQSAAIALYLIDAQGNAVSGAQVSAPVGTLNLPYYDGPSGVDWIEDGLTGERGAALLIGVPTLDERTDIEIQAGPDSAKAENVPLRPASLTFATVEVP
jgi:hypothetical protein